MENIYLKLDGVKGDSASDQGKDQIEVLSFSHGVSMPINDSAASGISVKHGRCDHQQVTFSKYLDSATAALYKHCAGGSNKKDAIFTFFVADKADGKPVELYRIELEDVLVANVSFGGGNDGLPVETVSLHYNKIKWTYTPQGRDSPGGGKGKVSTGWDLEKNTKV